MESRNLGISESRKSSETSLRGEAKPRRGNPYVQWIASVTSFSRNDGQEIFRDSEIPRFRNSESGSALVYILIAIALLGALTVTFMEPSSQQTTTQNTFKTAQGIKSQADFIRTSVQECVLIYGEGDDTVPRGSGEAEEGHNLPFPLAPDSPHYTGLTGDYAPASGRLVRDLRCPGNNLGPPNSEKKKHRKIFTGQSGKFLPPKPDLFDEWQWYNGPTGVFFWTETDKTDAFLQSSIDKLEDEFAKCEADKIVASGSNFTMSSSAGHGPVVCPSGKTCFRVWIVNNDAPAALFQEAGCGT